MEIQKALKFLDCFSVITVGDDKIPNFSWKPQQAKKLSESELSYRLQYKGGKKFTDGDGIEREIKPTVGYGIVTGFEHLEVLDIDLKVFSTAKEQKDFWTEFVQYLSDNILDFEEKFVIYKTRNAGYHILYKTKRVQGNLKLAKLKGHKEAVIETRGTGGYVFVYPDNKISKRSYFELDYISDDDREILFSFSRMYNYVEELPKEPAKTKTEYASGVVTPWQDYNEKNDIFSIINDEFTVVANHSKRFVIKRHGATSPHSGYIFKDSGCMYLFSTGTIYPHETLITPFLAYAHKFHGGNFSEAASKLYADGYGSRIEKKIKEKQKALPDYKDEVKEYLYNSEHLKFPIDIFPEPIQNYILECHRKLDSNIDYMGCSLLWLISVCIGNSIELQVKTGWVENCSLWISLVGRAGIGKTPSINNIIFPLVKINQREIKKYYKALDEYEKYCALDKKEKEQMIPIQKPIKSQFIANDITIEALVDLHQESDNAVGVFKDELAGWIKDMNKYRAGSDLEFWLSCWSGKSVNLNRLTRRGSYVEKPFIPVLGGIQPNIFNSFYTDDNKDNGFLDRMLLSLPEATIEHYNEQELSSDVLSWYKDNVISFFDTIKFATNRDNENNIVPHTAIFSDEAKNEWIRIFNTISDNQNSDNENEYLKSMYPKQKSYIPRFCLIIHAFNDFFTANGNSLLISKESVLKAEKLSNYFIATAKKVKVKIEETQKMKSAVNSTSNKSEAIESVYKENPDFNKSELADLLNVSRQYIHRVLKELNKKEV